MTQRWFVGIAVTVVGFGWLAALASDTPVASAAPVPRAVPRAPAPADRYQWPLSGTPSVTRPFQPPPQPWLPGHRGVDLAAMPGAVVRAAGAGTVAFAGQVAGTGVVSVQHPDGLRTTYEPVRPLVRTGQRVQVGTPIGILLAGHPGCPVPACLHWGLRRGAVYLDPLSLLRAARVRLLPYALSRAGRPAASLAYSSGSL